MKVRGQVRGGALRSQREDGFSLLEVMIALVIMSLVSLATFQSLTQMTALSDKAGRTASRTLDATLDRAVFTELVRGLTQAWSNEELAEFTGDTRGFSALSSAVPLGERQGLKAFTLRVADGAVILRSEGTQTVWREAPGGAAFAFMGTDQLWREAWPPETSIPYGPAEAVTTDDHIMSGPPTLPRLVRLSFADGEVWMASLSDVVPLPATAAEQFGF